MASITFKTVILFDRERVQPETLKKIEEASDGELIGCDPAELGSFVPMLIAMPEIRKAKKESEKRMVEGGGRFGEA